MALQDRPVRLTYEDYVLIPEDGQRHEILDGEHYVTASPFLRHQALVCRFTVALSPFIKANRLGEVFPAPTDVVLSRYDVVQPDLVFVSTARRHILTEPNIQGAPDLVIEILSPSTRRRDEGIKLGIYERFGVGECWLADPVKRAVSVFRAVEGRFLVIAALSAEAGDVLETPLLPGLEIRLAEIFA
jgi:Uma2 family endonuclease